VQLEDLGSYLDIMLLREAERYKKPVLSMHDHVVEACQHIMENKNHMVDVCTYICGVNFTQSKGMKLYHIKYLSLMRVCLSTFIIC